MDRARLALLVAAHEPADALRNFRRELPADLVEYQITDGELPDDVDVDGFVVTGSKAAVYDDTEWIREAKEWVVQAYDAGLPGLGVCFGHQLLAAALGGTVEAMGEYELGYRTVTHGGDPLFDSIDRTFLGFETHSDRVVSLPDGATQLAENDYGIQSFRKETAVGVQFHPEYDLKTARRVASGKDVSEEQWERVEAGLTAANRRRAAQAALVFENFVAGIETRDQRQRL